MVMKNIRVLVVEPMEIPKVRYIPCNSEFITNIFEDNTEVIVTDKNVGIIRNKNGALFDFKGNRKVDDEIIAGTFLVVGIDDSGFISSLSVSDMPKYTDRFRNLEIYTDQEVGESYWRKYEESINELEECLD
jgi:hypothetical protein